MYDYDLISIGSGSTGRTVAAKLKRKGWKVGIVERNVENSFGGTCINNGCIPSKALIEGVKQITNFTSLQSQKNSIVKKIHDGTVKHVHERLHIDIIEGDARFIDTHTIEVNGVHYSSEFFVIATGSRPSIPSIPGLSDVQFSTSDNVLKLESPPKRLLTIGGGRIGLELSLMLHKAGTEVFIFEGTDQLIPGEDEVIVGEIEKHLKKLGINIYKGRFVDKISQTKDIYTVYLEDGPFKGSYDGDYLLIATGRWSQTENLDIEKIGVKTDNGRIPVNSYLQTNLANIFAGGDVIGNPMFTNWAYFHGSLIASNLFISKTESHKWNHLPSKHIPRVTFIDPELASVGLTEREAREKYSDQVVTHYFQNRWLGKSLILNEAVGMLKGIGRKGSNEILGVHLWGSRSGSLIQTVILAMENELGWKELKDMIYAHPVLAEGISGLANGMVEQIGI